MYLGNQIGRAPRVSAVIAGAVGVFGVVFDWLSPDLSTAEAVMGTVLWGALAVGCLGYLAIHFLRQHPRQRLQAIPGRAWRLYAYSGPEADGVGIPLQPMRRSPKAVFAACVGVGVLGCAVYIAITGVGVTGGPHSRWIATAILGGAGLLTLLGALVVLARSPYLASNRMILTPQALWLPPATRCDWDAIGRISGRWAQAVQVADPVLLADVWPTRAGGPPMCSIDVSAVPNPNSLVDALVAPLADPALRERLGEPETVVEFRRFRPTA